jgi:hypothetical protein
MHYSRIHSAVCPMKCDMSAQLTIEIITHLSNVEHKMKFHITIQFKLLETNDIIDIDKIVICLITILIEMWRKLHYLIKETGHINGECISENSDTRTSSYVLPQFSLIHYVAELLDEYVHSCVYYLQENLLSIHNFINHSGLMYTDTMAFFICQ